MPLHIQWQYFLDLKSVTPAIFLIVTALWQTQCRFTIEHGADTVEMHGGHFPEDLFYNLGGFPSVKIVEILNDKFGTNLEPELIATEKELLYVERIAETRPIKEVADFAREVALSAKVAVASGGILPVVTQALEVIGLKDFFAVIVTSEQVKRGKTANWPRPGGSR